jgi:para-aminobenzoate synthetase component I
MRVVRREAASSLTPLQVFLSLEADARDVVWLDSGSTATSGFSFVGTGSTITQGGSLDALRHVPIAEEAAPLGWIGWLGYELRAETTGAAVHHASRYPNLSFLWVDRGVLFDHATGAVHRVSLDEEWDFSPTTTAQHPQGPDAQLEYRWAYSDERYLDMVRQCQAAIVEGEAYQLCLTNEAEIDGPVDAVASYLALRASSETHHGAFVRIRDVAVLSASPEQFLSISPEGVIESKPIKGTRPRGVDAATDAALIDELHSSEKERAENLMIVDLMRNDIGRVSALGSVEVTSLLAVESYPHVHQLVSTVRGQLADGVDTVDAIGACFPAGSMTGAPKRRATEILDSVEERARGIYSGAIGYLSVDGSVDLAMVIRSIIVDAHGATIGAGGGITALSVPEEELAEAKLKASALLAAVRRPARSAARVG